MAAAFLVFSGLWQVFALGDGGYPSVFCRWHPLFRWSACRSWASAAPRRRPPGLVRNDLSDAIVLSPAGEIPSLASRGKVARLSPESRPCARCGQGEGQAGHGSVVAAAREGRGLQMAVDMRPPTGAGDCYRHGGTGRGGAAVIRLSTRVTARRRKRNGPDGNGFPTIWKPCPSAFSPSTAVAIVYANARVRALFGLEPRTSRPAGDVFPNRRPAPESRRWRDWLTIWASMVDSGLPFGNSPPIEAATRGPLRPDVSGGKPG